jgi:hypothetical protein
MKAFPWFVPIRAFVPKGIVLLGGVLALNGSSAFAGLMIDLRVGAVSGAGSIADDKSVFGVDVGSIITLQVWAEITADATPVNNIYGIQRLNGSIVTRSFPETGGNVRGNMSPAVIQAPFNNVSVPGQVTELSIPADGSLDLGSNLTTALTGTIGFRHDPTTGGEGVPTNPTFLFVTNNFPVGATVHPLPAGGYEFFMGTADFVINAILNETDPALTVNWQIPAVTSPALKGQRAIWTEGDGVGDTGSAQGDLMSVGSAVEISAAPSPVPEPGAFPVLLSGLATLVAFQRRRLS